MVRTSTRLRSALVRLLPILALSVFPVAGFWLYTVAMGVADGGSGAKRLAAVWIGVAGVIVLRLLPDRTFRSSLVLRCLIIIVAVLAAARIAGAAVAVAEDRVPNVDIGRVTIVAAELTISRDNPYTADIDPNGRAVDPDGEGFRFFGGFKYGPLMAWANVPAIWIFGSRGYFLANLFFLGLALTAAYAWARQEGGQTAAVGAIALILATSFLGYELFYRGANDMLPIALALTAFAVRVRGAAPLAGLAWGMSFGAKALPAGLVFLPLLFLSNRRAAFATSAFATALAIHTPALLQSPRELIAGLVFFNLAKTPERTSTLSYLPDVADAPVAVLATAAAFIVPLVWGLGGSEKRNAWGAIICAAAIGLFFIGSVQVHRNYLLWVIPFLAIAAATQIWRRGALVEENECQASAKETRAPRPRTNRET